MLARLARLLTGFVVLAAALAGCEAQSPAPSPTSTPKTSIDELLLPTAAPRCTDAFAAGRPVGTPAPGSVSGQAVALIQYDFSQLEEKYREGNPPFGTWRRYPPYNAVVVPHRAQATSTDAVQTLVCVRQTYIQVGIYRPDDHAAVRLDWDIRVVRWPSGEPISGKTFRGPDPPQKVELKGYGRCTEAKTCATKSGGVPVDEPLRWLEELIAR